ncbi:SET domain-containing protein [Entamoeba marina]
MTIPSQHILDSNLVTDIRYNITLPQRDDLIDRDEISHYSQWQEVYQQYQNLKVQNIPDKGNGIIACQNFKKGEQILMEKAAIYSCIEDDEERYDNTTYYMCLDIYENRCSATIEMMLSLAINPNNTKAYENESKLIFNMLMEEGINASFDDVSYLVNMIHTNSFMLDYSYGTCIYLMASRFNHQCNCNAIWHTIGDKLIITAKTDIFEGEEITISYICAMLTQKRKHYLLSNYGFECQCSLCSSGKDIWRVFTCKQCNGDIISIETDDFQCQNCGRIVPINEKKEILEEESTFSSVARHLKPLWLYYPNKYIKTSHMKLYKSLRRYINTTACVEKINICKDILLPIAKQNTNYYHGRLLASMYEQLGVVYLRKASECKLVDSNSDDILKYKNNALNAFTDGYNERCKLGMGETGYAGAIFKEYFLMYLGETDLSDYVIYHEY